jgi:hypothetical protein
VSESVESVITVDGRRHGRRRVRGTEDKCEPFMEEGDVDNLSQA